MASKYWVGGGSNTNWFGGATTNWANSSGGAGNQTEPTTGDDVFFDASSGSGTSVCNTSISLRSLDCNGYTGTLTHNVSITITITGTNASAPSGFPFRLATGMTYTLGNSTSSAVAFSSTTGTTGISTEGKTLGNVTFTGVGGTWQLNASQPFTSSGTVTLTSGTIDSNNENMTMLAFSSTNSNTRAWTPGSSTITITGTTAVPWNTFTNAGLTFTAGTSSLVVNGDATGARTMLWHGLTFNNVTISASSPNANTLSLIAPNTVSNVTIANLTITNYRNLTTRSNNTLTISGTFSWTGNTASAPGSWSTTTDGNNLASSTTISVAGATTFNWALLTGLTKAGAGSISAVNCFDGGNLSGVTVTSPVLTRFVGG